MSNISIKFKLLFSEAPKKDLIMSFNSPPTLYFALNSLIEKYELKNLYTNDTLNVGYIILLNDTQITFFDSKSHILQKEDTISILGLVHGGK